MIFMNAHVILFSIIIVKYSKISRILGGCVTVILVVFSVKL